MSGDWAAARVALSDCGAWTDRRICGDVGQCWGRITQYAVCRVTLAVCSMHCLLSGADAVFVEKFVGLGMYSRVLTWA